MPIQADIHLRAVDGNSPLWRQIYEKKVRNAHPHMSKEEQQQQIDQLVNMRRAKKLKTKLGGKKRSRRKSRNLLSFLNFS
jgi:hypothetical protein